ncbi:unnamed protein product [Ectocarpus sp. CCAP 1310/34]|nr:unnamed protein product [Ectocarpus sp. CCAP 1310/34]
MHMHVSSAAFIWLVDASLKTGGTCRSVTAHRRQPQYNPAPEYLVNTITDSRKAQLGRT